MAEPRSPNHLLAALPDDEYARLEPHLEAVDMPYGKMLHRAGQTVDTIYFPYGGVCSMTCTMSDGRRVEVGTVGREGVLSHVAGLGDNLATTDAMVQIPGGEARALPLTVFETEMERRGALHHLVASFARATQVLAAQSVACNALHTADQRCARWLLMAHDRVGADTFRLSHEFLAVMLGVRRPTATIVAGTLSQAGLITYRRGNMTILNRQGLEDASCECYHAVQKHFRRLLPYGQAVKAEPSVLA